MFKSKAPSLPPETDYTKNLRETSFYRYGHLRSLGLTGDITALAVEPLLSLLAIGTSSGVVHVFGQPALQFALPVSGHSSFTPVCAIKFLTFHPGHDRLIAVDSGNTLHSYSLQHFTDHTSPLTHPPLPLKEGECTLGGTITSIEQPVPSHTQLFITMKDGSTLAWDLSRRVLAQWRVGNCWGEYEERMVRSGIPGRRKTMGGCRSPIFGVASAMHEGMSRTPRRQADEMQTSGNLPSRESEGPNIMLIGYEGGVVAWNMQKGGVDKTFEMTLPPGGPGGGSYLDAGGSLWTERTPSITCISWRPDGLVFAVGHSDGCITFWAYSESDRPLMVRTITHEDVNVIDAESLFDAGALDNQLRREEEKVVDREGYAVISAVRANREPIFKLSWAGFPDQLSLKTLMASQGSDSSIEPVTNATMEYAGRGETLLLILGGQSPGEKPGINILQFPAYQAPAAAAQRRGTTPMSPSESMPLQERYAYRDSLAPTGSSSYPTKTPPEDFVLLPRSSPHFGLAHDPVALIVSLTADPKLSQIEGPSAQTAFEAWAFPPPRSVVIPPSPGKKNFIQPGEDEKLVAMTPVPRLSSTPNTPQAGMATPGWRLPWTAGSSPRSPSIPSPTFRVPGTPDSLAGPSRGPRANHRRKYRPPASIWSGSLTVLGCEIHALATPIFKRLISWSIEVAGKESVTRLPVQGGMAVPDFQSHGAPDVKQAKMESYRVLITFHPEAIIRFWDASPQLLLLPTPLRFEYPSPLPHLTFSVGDYLKHPDVEHLPLAKLWETDRSKVRIKSVHLAREAFELTITFATGEIMVAKFGEAKKGAAADYIEELDGDYGGPSTPKDNYFPPQWPPPSTSSALKNDWVEEVTEIGHLANWREDGFKPVAIFTLKRGEAVGCAVSDIGFIAVAFASMSMAILDMRGPDVILREGFNEEGVATKKRRKKGNVQNVPGETSVVGAMKWVVSGMGSGELALRSLGVVSDQGDPARRPRLIVSYAKGTTKIYSLANVLGEWIVEPKPPTFTNDSIAGPLASFVLDPLTGVELTPSAELLHAAMKVPHSPEGKSKDTSAHCLWIAGSRKSVRCAVNFNGERVAKIELEEDELSEVFYVTRYGQKVLVGITTTGAAMFWSMPFLVYITRMDLSRRIGRVSMDDRSGDFVEYSGPIDINLRTLFHFRKPYPPRLDPCSLKRVVPPQPVPLTASTMVGSWIWGGAPLTGAQLDTIVAGRNRAPLPKAPSPPKKPLVSWGNPPEEIKSVLTANTIPKRTTVAKQKAPTRDARERNDVYSEMTSAVAERGNYLEGLEDSLNNVSMSATNYLSQAKNSALKEAAKTTAKGMFGKLL